MADASQAPEDWGPIYESAGRDHGVDPDLLRAVVHVESRGDPDAVSPQGALGPTQLMPDTARSLGVTDPSDPHQSIPATAKLLRENLDRYGTPEAALMAYHGGTDQRNWGPKTRAYPHLVAAAYSVGNGHGHASPTASGNDFDWSTASEPQQPAGLPPVVGKTPAETAAFATAAANNDRDLGRQPKNVIDQALDQYPILKAQGVVGKMNLGGGGGYLESWPEGEEGVSDGGLGGLRPKDIPIDKFGVEVRDPKTRPIDVLADVVSHRMVKTDPTLKSAYDQFAKSITPEQEARLHEQYAYAQKNEGEKGSYDDWKQRAGLPAYFRGYTFKQWPDSFTATAYTPEQKKLLDGVMSYLSASGKNSPSTTFDKQSTKPPSKDEFDWGTAFPEPSTTPEPSDSPFAKPPVLQELGIAAGVGDPESWLSSGWDRLKDLYHAGVQHPAQIIPGAAEGLTSAVGGVAGAAAAGAAGTVAGVKGLLQGKGFADPFEAGADKVQQAMAPVLEPRTEVGKAATNFLGLAPEAAARAGENIFETTHSPALAAGTETLGNALMFLPGMGRGKAKVAEAPPTPSLLRSDLPPPDDGGPPAAPPPAAPTTARRAALQEDLAAAQSKAGKAAVQAQIDAHDKQVAAEQSAADLHGLAARAEQRGDTASRDAYLAQAAKLVPPTEAIPPVAIRELPSQKDKAAADIQNLIEANDKWDREHRKPPDETQPAMIGLKDPATLREEASRLRELGHTAKADEFDKAAASQEPPVPAVAGPTTKGPQTSVPPPRGPVASLTPMERDEAAKAVDVHPDSVPEASVATLAHLMEHQPDEAERLLDEHRSNEALAAALTEYQRHTQGDADREDGTGGRGAPEAASAFGEPGEAGGQMGRVDQAAHEAATSPLNARPEPTPGQIEAGNYRKGHVRIQGLDISIENPIGSTRRGISPDGRPWESPIVGGHYGYFTGHKPGLDGDHTDVFVGPHPESPKVFVVDQVTEDGKLDEHKAMLGYDDKDQAEAAYRSNYPANWKGMGAISEMSMPVFKRWLATGNKARRVVDTAWGKKAADPLHPWTPVDTSKSVPLAGGVSDDGRTIYIDKRIPKYVFVEGKRIDAHEAIALHEATEFPRMKELGEDYATAHKAATEAENTFVAQKYGVDPQRYQKALTKAIADARREAPKAADIPKDLDAQPYEDDGQTHLLENQDANRRNATTQDPGEKALEPSPRGKVGSDETQRAEAVAPADLRFKEWLGRVAKRHVAEARGQDILDSMEAAGESPQSVAKTFWDDTYFKLPSEVQARFRRQLAEHTGFGNIDPPDIEAAIDNLDLGDKAENLEGTERGFVALMKEANDRVGEHDAATTGKEQQGDRGQHPRIASRAAVPEDEGSPRLRRGPEAGDSDSDSRETGGQVQKAPNAVRRLKHTADSLRSELHAAIGKGLDNLESAGTLQIHDDASTLPESLSEAIRRQVQNDPTIRALYDPATKVAHLIASRIPKGTGVAHLLHELGEHHGMQEILGRDKYNKYVQDLRELRNSGNPEVRAAWDHVRKNYPKLDENSAQFVREVAARLAEKAHDLPWVKRIFNEIRAWLYKKFGIGKLDEGIIRGLASQMLREAGKRGKPLLHAPDASEPMFARGDEDDFKHEEEPTSEAGRNGRAISDALDPKSARKIGRLSYNAAVGNLDRVTGKAERAMHASEVAFDKMLGSKGGRDKILDQYNLWETHQPITDPYFRDFFKQMEAAFNQRWQAVTDTGRALGFIQNYMPHLWQKPDKAGAFYHQMLSKNPIEGNKSWTKERKIPTIKQGMEYGLELETENPARLMLAHLRQMDKYIEMHKVRTDLEAHGMVIPKPDTLNQPPGWAEIKDPAFTKALVPELIAKDYNNLLAPSLYNQGWWRSFRYAQNALISARLGWGFFHAGLTTFDTMASHFDDGWKRALSGDVVGAVKSFVKTPLSPIASPLTGWKELRQFYGQVAADPHTEAVLRALAEGGAKGKADPTDYNKTWTRLMRSIHTGDKLGMTGNAAMAAWENVGPLIHNYLVPWQKMTAKTLMMKFELDRVAKDLGKKRGDYAGIVGELHPDSLRQMAGRVVDQVDNRLGQFNYDRMFWNRPLRDMLQAAVQSLGWNVGSLKTIVGGALGAKDIVGPEPLVAPLDRAGKTTGNMGRISPAFSYLISMNLLGMTANMGLSQILTGQAYQNWRDLFSFRTGRKNADGSDERMYIPTYMRDELAYATAPVKTAVDKLHPSFNIAAELAQNKDYYGNPIVNDADDPDVQTGQVGRYLAKQLYPYSVQNLNRAQEAGKGGWEQYSPFIGIAPAPASVTRSPFQNYVTQKYFDTMPRGGMTPEQQDTAAAKRAQLQGLREGDDVDLSNLSLKQQRAIEKQAHTEIPAQRFEKLPLDQMLAAWKKAKPEEREQYGLRSKILQRYNREVLRGDLRGDALDHIRDQIDAVREDDGNP